MKKETWKRIGLMILVFSLNYGLDRITKILAMAKLKGSGIHSFFGGTALLVYAENDGAFLSMGSSWPYLVKVAVFIILPLVVCLYGLWYSVAKESSPLRALIIVTIVAGGIGNLQDRLFNSFRVVDFMNFGIGDFRTGILNFGDVSVTFGVIALAIAVYLADRREALAAGKAGSSPEAGKRPKGR